MPDWLRKNNHMYEIANLIISLSFVGILLVVYLKIESDVAGETVELHQSLSLDMWRIKDWNFFSLLSAGSTVF